MLDDELGPEERLLAIGRPDLPDGLYRLSLAGVLCGDGVVVERWRIVEAPGSVYEEVRRLADADCERP